MQVPMTIKRLPAGLERQAAVPSDRKIGKRGIFFSVYQDDVTSLRLINLENSPLVTTLPSW